MSGNDPGRKIKERRLALGYSRGQLAASVDATPTNIAAWEKGDEAPDGDVIPKLAKVLGIGSHELVTQLAAGAPAFSDAADTAAADAATKVRAAKGNGRDGPAPAIRGTDLPGDAGSGAPEDDGRPPERQATAVAAGSAAPERDALEGHRPGAGTAEVNQPAAEVEEIAAELAEASDAPLAGVAAIDVEATPEPVEGVAGVPSPPTGKPIPDVESSPDGDGRFPRHDVVVPTAGDISGTHSVAGDRFAAAAPVTTVADAPAGLTDAPTEAVPVVASPAVPVAVAATASAPPAPRTTEPSQGPFQDVLAAVDRFQHVVFDPERPYHFWIRTALTIVFLLIGLRILAWAVPAFFDALADILDTIESTTPDTTFPSG